MSSPYQKPSVSRRIVQVVLTLALIVIVVVVWDRARLHMSGAHRAALEQRRECEQARDLLGENIDSGWWGHHGYLHVPRRSSAWSATRSSVDWWMPVAGSTGKGTLHFRGKKEGGFWTLNGFLEVDGTKVYMPKCEALSSDSP